MLCFHLQRLAHTQRQAPATWPVCAIAFKLVPTSTRWAIHYTTETNPHPRQWASQESGAVISNESWTSQRCSCWNEHLNQINLNWPILWSLSVTFTNPSANPKLLLLKFHWLSFVSHFSPVTFTLWFKNLSLFKALGGSKNRIKKE